MDEHNPDEPINLQETVEQAGMDKPLCVEADLSIRQVLAMLQENRVGSVLVCKDEKLTGIFTERDVVKLLASGADLDARIDTVMSRNPQTTEPTDTIAVAIQRMSRGGYRRLPVIDAEGRPVGVVKVTLIVHYLVQHFPEAVYNLPPDPNSVTKEREGA